MSGEIIGLDEWLQTPAGRYLLAWEQERHDELVADIFGYYAVQLGLPQLHGLQCNRMPHRWLAQLGAENLPTPAHAAQPTPPIPPVQANCMLDAHALPFSENTLDLVLMPHTLELSPDPHAALREVHRVLVPEGRVLISGLNPWSLWGLRQRRAWLYQRLGAGGQPYLPQQGEFIAPGRLRDWLQLLGLELESISFGCYRPAVQSQHWLERHAWADAAGPRWWPILGAAYLVVASKRVHGMRLLEPDWRSAKRRTVRAAAVARRTGKPQ